MAKFHTLRDTFDGSINPAVWSTTSGVTWVADAGGGHVESLEDTTSNVLSTVSTYDLTGSHVSCRFEFPATVNSPVYIFRVSPTATGDGDAAWFVRVNNSDLACELITGGNTVSTLTLTYSPTNHRYLRIAESAGTISWWTSADGSTWTQRHSAPAPTWGSNLTALYARFLSITFAPPLGQAAVIDDINAGDRTVTAGPVAAIAASPVPSVGQGVAATPTVVGTTATVAAPTVTPGWNGLAYVASGALARATAAATSPGLPPSVRSNDLLVLVDGVVSWSGTGGPATPGTPAGWTPVTSYSNSGTSGLARITLYYRLYQPGDAAPTVGYTANSGGGSDNHASQIHAYRGNAASNVQDAVGPGTSVSQSSTVVGPISGLTTTGDGSMVIVAAVRDDTLTSSTVLTGDGLTWLKRDDYSNATANGLSMLVQHATTSSPLTVTSKTISVNATDAAAAAVMWAVRAQRSATPATVAAAASLPAVTTRAGASPVPATVGAGAGAPAPSPRAGAGTGPTTVAMAASVAAVVPAMGSTIAGPPTAAVSSVPTPMVGGGTAVPAAVVVGVATVAFAAAAGGVRAAPPTTAGPATIGPPVVTTGATVGPAPLTRAVMFPAAQVAILTGATTVTTVATVPPAAARSGTTVPGGTVGATGAVPTGVATGGAGAAPDPAHATTGVTAPGPSTGSTIAAAAVAVVADLARPALGAIPAPVTAAAGVPSPPVSVGSTVAATACDATTGGPAAAVSAGQTAPAGPVAAAAVPAPAMVRTGTTVAAPATPLPATVPAAQVGLGSAAPAGPVGATAALPVPVPAGGATATAAAPAATGTVPAVTLTVDIAAGPAAVALRATVPAPAASGGMTVPAGPAVATTAALPTTPAQGGAGPAPPPAALVCAVPTIAIVIINRMGRAAGAADRPATATSRDSRTGTATATAASPSPTVGAAS